jgi:predicted dehydrogenase
MDIAVVGAGIIGADHLKAIEKNSNFRLVAVCDNNEERARLFSEKYGVPYYFTEKEMFEGTDAEAVYIGTPVACHYEQAMLALQYGKHVFMEKPIALTASDGEKLVEAFKKAGKQFTIGYMMKYHNLHEKAKQLVQTGKIGQVNDIRAQFSCWYPDIEGAWRQKKSLGGGGSLMDLGVHCIELIEFILEEEIVEVKSFCSTRSFKYEVEDSAVIIFKTTSGVLGHIDVNFNIPDDASESKLELYGNDGCIICKGTLSQEEVGTLSHLYSPQGAYSAMQNRTVGEMTEEKGAGDDLYLKQIRIFVEQVKSGKPDYFYAERAVQVQKIVDLIYNNK